MTDSDNKLALIHKFQAGELAPADLPLFFDLFSEIGNNNPVLQAEAREYTGIVEFELSGLGNFWLAVIEGKYSNGSGKHPESILQLIMNPVTAAGIFTGDVNAEIALQSGDIRLNGNYPDAEKFYLLLETILEEMEN